MAEIIIKSYEEIEEIVIKNLKDGIVISIEIAEEEDLKNAQEIGPK